MHEAELVLSVNDTTEHEERQEEERTEIESLEFTTKNDEHKLRWQSDKDIQGTHTC